jgi:hypothetical protein
MSDTTRETRRSEAEVNATLKRYRYQPINGMEVLQRLARYETPYRRRHRRQSGAPARKV